MKIQLRKNNYAKITKNNWRNNIDIQNNQKFNIYYIYLNNKTYSLNSKNINKNFIYYMK